MKKLVNTYLFILFVLSVLLSPIIVAASGGSLIGLVITVCTISFIFALADTILNHLEDQENEK